MNKNRLKQDYTFTILGRGGETMCFTLRADAKDRFAELDRVLLPMHLMFADERYLVDDRGSITDEPVAELLTSSEDLTVWVLNEPELCT